MYLQGITHKRLATGKGIGERQASRLPGGIELNAIIQLIGTITEIDHFHRGRSAARALLIDGIRSGSNKLVGVDGFFLDLDGRGIRRARELDFRGICFGVDGRIHPGIDDDSAPYIRQVLNFFCHRRDRQRIRGCVDGIGADGYATVAKQVAARAINSGKRLLIATHAAQIVNPGRVLLGCLVILHVKIDGNFQLITDIQRGSLY